MQKMVYTLNAHNPAFSEQLIKELRLRDFLFLRTIADRKSLSSAAQDFSLTQPAASRWLRELEQLFRAHLFIRDRMVGMTPTPLGELLVERGRILLSDVEVLSAELEAHRAGRGGHLSLGVIPYVSARLLEKLVSTLVGEHAMTVSVVEAATEPLMDSLRLQKLHAVIGRCSTTQSPDVRLRQEVFFAQKACLLVHATSEHCAAQSGSLNSYAECRWVTPPTESPTWQAIVAVYRDAKLMPPHPVVETASTKFVHALVANNIDMVAVLPFDVGSDLEKLGGVRVVPFPAAFKMPSVGLIGHARQWNLSHVAVLRATLRQLAATGVLASQ